MMPFMDMSLSLSKRSIVSARALPPRPQLNAELAHDCGAIKPGIGGPGPRASDIRLCRIGTICGDRPSRSAAISTIALANSNQLASPAPAK